MFGSSEHTSKDQPSQNSDTVLDPSNGGGSLLPLFRIRRLDTESLGLQIAGDDFNDLFRGICPPWIQPLGFVRTPVSVTLHKVIQQVHSNRSPAGSTEFF